MGHQSSTLEITTWYVDLCGSSRWWRIVCVTPSSFKTRWLKTFIVDQLHTWYVDLSYQVYQTYFFRFVVWRSTVILGYKMSKSGKFSNTVTQMVNGCWTSHLVCRSNLMSSSSMVIWDQQRSKSVNFVNTIAQI